MEDQVRLRKAPSIRNNSTSSAAADSSCNSSILNCGYNSSEDDNIKVYVRIRPPSKEVADGDNESCLEVTSSNSLKISTKPEPKQFSYDHVAGMQTTQEEVFATVGKGIMEQFVAGFNGTIFAYGQTGSGKTFTMLGPSDDSDSFSHELRGVIPRGFEYIFSLMNHQQEKVGDRVEFLAKCSFLEIYNESVYDLLEPSTAVLALRENIKKGVFVEGLTERTVLSAKDAYNVLQSGWLNRRVASTSMNRESSRSHAVFTISLESKTRNGGVANIKESKLHLVDLAGSERQKDTQAADVRLKEAGSINKSLSALGNVIMALVDIAHGKTRYIHYRDSKLTFILRDSLGGNAKTYIIANVHPSSRCFGETLSTLNFARRAKMIKNKAIINQDVTGNVPELQAEIKRLKELLADKSKTQDVENVPLKKEDSSIDASPVVKSSSLSDDGVPWQQMMLSAISERENVEKDKIILLDKVEKLEELSSKKEKFLQSTRMILKFRTQHIAKLEKQLKKELGPSVEEDEKDKQIKLLKEEIKVLQSSVEHHPDVKKYQIDNLELRSEIRRLKAHDPSNGDFMKDMAETHRYTHQLERQIRELMTNKVDMPNSEQTLEASQPEIENMKMELAQVQAKLDTCQKELQETRQSLQQSNEYLMSKTESFRNKEMDMQSDLAAVRKAKNELERVLEAHQLKTAIDRTTLNNIHMQTVKTLSSPRKISSPRKFGTPRTPLSSISDKNSTPLKKGFFNGNTPANGKENNKIDEKSPALEDVLPPKGMDRTDDSLTDFSASDNEPEVFRFWNSSDETRDAEVIYIESLQEEIKQLQNLYDQSLEAINQEQKKKIPLIERVTKLEHQAKELEEVLKNERNTFLLKETELSTHLVSAKDKYKESYGCAALLKSEVEDLRIMYSSVCKQLDTAKKEKTEDHIESGRKCAAVESKLVKVQIDFYNLQAELDQTVESNNNLMRDYEQCKEELQFTHHKNSVLKKKIEDEKKNVKEAENNLESALEKLRYELETKITLTREDKQEELMKAMQVSNELRDQLHELTRKSKEQETLLEKFKNDLESARAEVVTQKWHNQTDKEAINKFMKTVQDLHITINEKENVVTSLQSEVEDLKGKHENLQNMFDDKQRHIEELIESAKCESEKHFREKTEHEKEVTNVQKEIQIVCDENKQLSCALDELREHNELLKGENVEKKGELSEKIVQISSLEESLLQLKLKNEQAEASQEDYITCNENLTHLSESWDAIKLDLETENKILNKKNKEMQLLVSDRDVLESRLSILELELEDKENQLKEKQEVLVHLDDEVKELKAQEAQQDASVKALLRANETLMNDKSKLEKDMQRLSMNLSNIQDDLEINSEELEKTKALEQRYFEENNQLQSRLAVLEEEKTRYEKLSKQLQKTIDNLELEKSKILAHQNFNQRIEHLMQIKKENLSLREENKKLLAGKSKSHLVGSVLT